MFDWHGCPTPAFSGRCPPDRWNGERRPDAVNAATTRRASYGDDNTEPPQQAYPPRDPSSQKDHSPRRNR
eukprot:4262849-Pyramimonas_sp.AAC.1